jgi:stage II sporulation protein D
MAAGMKPRSTFLLLFLMVGLIAAEASATQMVRIAVGRFRAPITVSGPDLIARAGDGTPLARGGPLVFAPGPRGILKSGMAISAQVVRIRNEGLIQLRGHNYRGFLEISWREYQGRPELLVVHPLPLEVYVQGVISAELPPSWPLEAFKAQAVAARTYAVWQKHRRLGLPYHMESSVLDPVYKGTEREHPLAAQATRETHGQVLTHGHRLARTYFHGACGDHTESGEAGWGEALAYLPGVKCGYCTESNRHRWKTVIPKKDADRVFRPWLRGPLKSIRILERTKTGRMRRVEISDGKRKKRLVGADVRRLLGYERVRSLWVTRIQLKGRDLIFSGRGSGHGVGMCQWGARGMANEGHAAGAILLHYFPGTEIRRMY